MECSKGWNKRCPASKGKKCTCSCGGQNHGKSHQRKDTQSEIVFGEVYHFKGFGTHDSKCGVKIIREEGETARVILTELPGNPGTSVTNAIEDIATLIYNEKLAYLPATAITWVEHYPERGKIKETFDQVTLTWNPNAPFWQGGKVVGQGRFEHPQWKPIDGSQVAA